MEITSTRKRLNQADFLKAFEFAKKNKDVLKGLDRNQAQLIFKRQGFLEISKNQVAEILDGAGIERRARAPRGRGVAARVTDLEAKVASLQEELGDLKRRLGG